VWVLAKQGGFQGTARALLARINEQEGILERNGRPEGWPANADALGKAMRRLIPVFGSVGIEVRQHRAKERIWIITEKVVSQASIVSEVTTETLV